MERVRLGRTGLQVSVACLGTGGRSRLGQRYGATFQESVAVVRAALDHGVNFIDTAATYGTDEMVGAAVAKQRDDVVLSTKVHIVRDASMVHDGDYVDEAELVRRVDGALARLRTDYVDVLYLHGVVGAQYDHAVRFALPVLERLREQGKVRYLAISERFTVEPLHDTLQRAIRDGHFDVVMVGLNMVNQTALRSVLPAASAHDVGVQAIYAVRDKLASRERARALVHEAIALGEVDTGVLDPNDPFGFVLNGVGSPRSLVEACYRFVRHSPGVHAVVTGTGSTDHLLDNLRSIAGPPLAEPILAELRAAFGRVQSVTAE